MSVDRLYGTSNASQFRASYDPATQDAVAGDMFYYGGLLYICKEDYTALNNGQIYRGRTNITDTTGSAFNVTLPTGSAAGDVAILEMASKTASMTVTGFTSFALYGNDFTWAGYKVLTTTDITNGYVALPGYTAPTMGALHVFSNSGTPYVDKKLHADTNTTPPPYTTTSTTSTSAGFAIAYLLGRSTYGSSPFTSVSMTTAASGGTHVEDFLNWTSTHEVFAMGSVLQLDGVTALTGMTGTFAGGNTAYQSVDYGWFIVPSNFVLPSNFVAVTDETPWITPTANILIAAVMGEASVRARKDSNNRVHIEGVFVSSGSVTGNTVLFILPAGFRPSTNKALVKLISSSGVTAIYCDTSGNIQGTNYITGSGVSLGASTTYALEADFYAG